MPKVDGVFESACIDCKKVVNSSEIGRRAVRPNNVTKASIQVIAGIWFNVSLALL